MNKDDTITVLLILILFLSFYIFLLNINFHKINKADWECTQARILDPKNVNETECVVYKKVIKDD